MQWSNEKPKVPGFWFYREDGEVEFFNLVWDEGELREREWNKPVKGWPGQWAGPMPEPDEPDYWTERGEKYPWAGNKED